MKLINAILLLVALLFATDYTGLIAQTYVDGPIQLQVRLRDIRIRYSSNSASDLNLNIGSLGLSNFEDDELTFFVWANDNANISGLTWQGGTCRQANLTMLNGGPDFSPDYNAVLYNYTYPTTSVPQYVSIRLDAWEDDVPTDFAIISGITACGSTGSRCTFETSVCCLNLFGCVFDEEDDLRCNANPYQPLLDYRLDSTTNQLISPCIWYDQGYVVGGGCTNNFYRPRIETFFRYTRGNGCADAIDLGAMASGSAITHFNNNSCYNNNFTPSPGNDVFYSFTINGPLGINASLCGINGAQFDSYLYLLDTNCNIEASNDNGCGSQSTVSYYLCLPGTYYLVVDGATAAAQGTFTLVLTEDTNFTFRSTMTKRDALCFGSNDGWAKVDVIGGFPPYTYQWSGGTGGTTTDSVYGLGPGTFYVDITDFKGCVITDTVVITEPTPLLLSLSSTNVQCSGYNDGTATVNPSGGTAPYTYLWITFPLQTTQTAVALGAGTYTVNVIDFNGCANVDSVTVNTTTQIILTTDTIRNVTCFGAADGYVNITLAGGNLPYTYNWSHGPTTEDVTNLSPGQYTVTVYDQDSCFVTSAYNIPQPTLLVTDIIDTLNLSCNGGSDGIITTITNGGTPPYSYLWSNGRTNPNLLNVTAGTYTLTVTDAQNCTTTTTHTLIEPAPLNIVWSVQNPQCFGQTNGSIQLTVTGGTAPYDYTWTTADTTRDISNLGEGVYGVLITDTNNCLYFDFAVLFTNARLEANVATVTNADCNGNNTGAITLDVVGGGGIYSYAWSNAAATGQNPTNLPAGPYSVTVTDQDGCADSTATVITQPSALVANITSTVDASCNGNSNGSISVDVTGGTQPYVYLWSNGSTLEDLVNLPAGSYQLNVTDAQNCQVQSLNTPISEPALLVTVLNGANPGCPGATNGSINLLVNGGTPPYTYNWSNGALTPNLTNVGSGTFTVVVTDNNGCTKSDTITLANSSALVANDSIHNLNCFGEANGSITLNVTGGSGPYTYTWSPAVGNSNSLTGLSGGQYDLTITDAQGCFASFSYTVDEPLELSLAISSTEITCFGDADAIATSTLIGGVPNYVYNWSNGQTTAAATGLSPGPLSLTIVDGNNCSVTASTTVVGPPQLVATVDSTFDVNCFEGDDGSVFINATGGRPGYIYSVENNIFQPSPTFFGLRAGDYNALVLDTNNCRVLVPFTINQPAAWEVYFEDPYVFISRGAQVALEPENNNLTGVVTYEWSPADGLSCTDCENPEASPLETTTYTLTATDSNGCIATEQIVVVIKNKYEIFFPNAFSPNGDGRNDVWAPIDFGSAGEIDIMIFNRWGEKVFQSNDILKGWNGTYKGAVLSPDTYLYYVKGAFLDGFEFNETGTLVLLR
jgi:gliding motility-associated-like protein